MGAPVEPRMRDVAERAGVSLSTVSRALREAPGVTPEVRGRVRSAADELSYVVSRNASSLVTRRTGRVGLLLPRLQRWFFAAVADALCDSLQEQQLDTIVYQLGDATAGGEVRSLPLRQNVDAVVAVSLDFADELTDQLDELALPTVFCSRWLQGRHCVSIDNAAAARTATQHLVNLGHRDIAYLHSRPLEGAAGNFGDRAHGYAEAMAAAGLPTRFERIAEGPAGGEAGMGRLLGATEVPTAVFAESDETAFGVLRVLRRSAVAVPAAVSVIGFDNHDLSDTFELTTIDQDVPALGRAAGRLVAELATAGIERPARHVRQETRLLVRGSTGIPRDGRVLSGVV
ncbi:MAG TPA: LacI family DNA-binding transcriptional regulator [Nocardioidaceae bacterium]|nr:LacI family DNA-binding transcriptional regulator [Nocardioidaceae bacterium]